MRKVKPKRRIRPIAKEKAKPKRKVHRNPYARALDTAIRRFDKAVFDYQRFVMKIRELEAELPKLEQMKLVLEEYLRKGSVGPRPDLSTISETPVTTLMEARSILNQPLPPRVATGPVAGFQVPGYLAHMIKEHPLVGKGSRVQGGVTHVQLPTTDPDDMLPDLGPGNDLIPDHQVIITEE